MSFYTRFNNLNVPDTWRQYYTKYPEGYTILESLLNWVQQVNDLTENVNNWNDYLDNFVESFDTDLRGKVTDILSDWQDSGILEVIINEALQTQLDVTDEKVLKIENDLKGRGVNLEWLGAKLDGVTDDYLIVRSALDTYKHAFIPHGKTLATSQTIFVGQDQTLEGDNENTSKIKYIGSNNNKKAVVVIGRNDVGAEPTLDGSRARVMNLEIDANNLAGFGIYGTYLTNQSIVDHVVIRNSLEYNAYFARGWYARFTNITSLSCRGKGIALGMPLEYLDGTKVTWLTSAPLELNNCKTEGNRSHSAGKYYRDQAGLFNPTNPLHRRQGYGIGAGVGNGFRLHDFLSEGSGGANLYVYSEFQPSKTVRKGYLENPCVSSGLDPATTMVNMIIESTVENNEMINIEDLFMNYQSGGIYHVGAKRYHKLKNISQPRFLKSLDGLSSNDLYAFILKESVYYGAGYYNTNEAFMIPLVSQTVNTRYSFTISTAPMNGAYKAVYVKGTGTTPLGSLVINYDDGTTASATFPSGLTTSEWKLVGIYPSKMKSVTKGGGTDSFDSNVEIKILQVQPTYI